MKKDASILITGCSSGIGLESAKTLHARGYKVFATARNPDDVTMLEELGLTALKLDVNDSENIERTVASVLARTGGTLDALFNNAGFGVVGAVEDLTRQAMRDQFETNLFGAFELISKVLPVMRRQGHGRIIQNSSVLGLIVMPFRGAYNASKFAMEGMTDTLRLELKGSNIFISLIEPGPIETKFRANAFKAYQRYIDPGKSAFRDDYQKMENRLTKEGRTFPFTLPSSAVVDKLIHALESSKPRTRYYVTFPTYLLATLKRILPVSILDKVLLKASKSD